MPLELAYGTLAGKDRRPLLCLRECLLCEGTDGALLADESDNEKTKLLSRWFHCVKLPPDVTDTHHAFHALFAGKGSDESHLFLARWDGSGRIDLNGYRSEVKLWQAMRTLLASDYELEAERSVKDLFVLLDQYDVVDARIELLQQRVDDLLEEFPADTPKVREVAIELEAARAERKRLEVQDARISDLRLRLPSEATTAAER
jgi:hypothetical protein